MMKPLYHSLEEYEAAFVTLRDKDTYDFDSVDLLVGYGLQEEDREVWDYIHEKICLLLIHSRRERFHHGLGSLPFGIYAAIRDYELMPTEEIAAIALTRHFLTSSVALSHIAAQIYVMRAPDAYVEIRWAFLYRLWKVMMPASSPPHYFLAHFRRMRPFAENWDCLEVLHPDFFGNL